jgi:hypothetical protein
MHFACDIERVFGAAMKQLLDAFRSILQAGVPHTNLVFELLDITPLLVNVHQTL